ncbi:MAG: 4Fe-4S binding protein [Eggerthellaceae bacterium]|nr:4Fe-4S binding protein [Eggerthellaceae bacterium]
MSWSTSPDGIRIPTLRTEVLDPLEYGRSTAFEAGYLVSRNAGWRQVRPVIDPNVCTGCLQCYLYCPDGTIRKTHAAKGDSSQAAVFVDLDFCKGCGICKNVCKFEAISMVAESEVE